MQKKDKIKYIVVAVCSLTLLGCTKENQELCGTVTEKHNPVVRAETVSVVSVPETTAVETTTAPETTVTETATTVIETVAETTAAIIEETTTITEITAESETTETETVTEAIEEIQEQESAEEMQETENPAESKQEDIVYISYSWDDDYYYVDDFTITTEDYILLCNCVAHEAGSDWYSDWEKAKVVEVIFNRVWSPAFPDTIYEVITQRNQFTGSAGYANLDGYSYEVTSLCCDGVDLYLSNPDLFNEGYLFFYGDDYMR